MSTLRIFIVTLVVQAQICINLTWSPIMPTNNIQLWKTNWNLSKTFYVQDVEHPLYHWKYWKQIMWISSDDLQLHCRWKPTKTSGRCGMMTRQQPDGKITELLLILLTICFNSFCHVLVLFKLRTFKSIYWLIFFLNRSVMQCERSFNHNISRYQGSYCKKYIKWTYMASLESHWGPEHENVCN